MEYRWSKSVKFNGKNRSKWSKNVKKWLFLEGGKYSLPSKRKKSYIFLRKSSYTSKKFYSILYIHHPSATHPQTHQSTAITPSVHTQNTPNPHLSTAHPQNQRKIQYIIQNHTLNSILYKIHTKQAQIPTTSSYFIRIHHIFPTTEHHIGITHSHHHGKSQFTPKIPIKHNKTPPKSPQSHTINTTLQTENIYHRYIIRNTEKRYKIHSVHGKFLPIPPRFHNIHTQSIIYTENPRKIHGKNFKYFLKTT